MSIGHVSPEAAVGGPIALLEEGDLIEIDIPANRILVDVSDEELARVVQLETSDAACYDRLFGTLRQTGEFWLHWRSIATALKSSRVNPEEKTADIGASPYQCRPFPASSGRTRKD